MNDAPSRIRWIGIRPELRCFGAFTSTTSIGPLASEQPSQLDHQVADWIARNPLGRQPAWHPYPTSLRIVNWMRAGLCGAQVEQSLARQAAFVAGNLEYHLGGNHLIENAFALLVAGLYFKGPAAQSWRDCGSKLLVEQLSSQSLDDGGHDERSLSYHFRVNLVCRETVALLRANGDTPPPWLVAKCWRTPTPMRL